MSLQFCIIICNFFLFLAIQHHSGNGAPIFLEALVLLPQQIKRTPTSVQPMPPAGPSLSHVVSFPLKESIGLCYIIHSLKYGQCHNTTVTAQSLVDPYCFLNLCCVFCEKAESLTAVSLTPQSQLNSYIVKPNSSFFNGFDHNFNFLPH